MAVLIDDNLPGVTPAAERASKGKAVGAAEQPAAAADGLGENADRADSVQDDVAIVGDRDVAAVAAEAVEGIDRQLAVVGVVATTERPQGPPASDAERHVAGHAAAAANRLREDAICAEALGLNQAVVGDRDVAAVAAGPTGAGEDDLADGRYVAFAAGATAAADALGEDAVREVPVCVDRSPVDHADIAAVASRTAHAADAEAPGRLVIGIDQVLGRAEVADDSHRVGQFRAVAVVFVAIIVGGAAIAAAAADRLGEDAAGEGTFGRDDAGIEDRDVAAVAGHAALAAHAEVAGQARAAFTAAAADGLCEHAV